MEERTTGQREPGERDELPLLALEVEVVIQESESMRMQSCESADVL